MPGEREVPAGMEEQDFVTETVHDARPPTRPNVERSQVRQCSSQSPGVLSDSHFMMLILIVR